MIRVLWIIAALSFMFERPALAQHNPVFQKQDLSNQIRQKANTLIKKYCDSSCELLDVKLDVESIAPDTDELGFEAISPVPLNSQTVVGKLALDIQIDDRISQRNRERLQKIIETGFQGQANSVEVHWAVVQVPEISTSENHEDALLKQLEQTVSAAIQRIFDSYCADQCILVRVAATGYSISNDEARRLNERQLFRDKGRSEVIKVSNVDVELSFDRTLPEAERNKLVNLVKAKTRFVEPVTVDFAVVDFPSTAVAKKEQAEDPYGLGKLRETLKIFRELAGTKEIISTSRDTVQSNSATTSTSNSTEKALSKESREQNVSNNTNSTNNTDSKSSSEKSSESSLEKSQTEQMYLYIAAGVILLIGIALVLLMRYRSAQREAQIMISQMPSSGQSSGVRENGGMAHQVGSGMGGSQETVIASHTMLATRHRIAELRSELITIFSSQPKVAKDTFTRLIQEEGFEETSKHVHIFGPMVVFELLDDPSIQRDLMDLSEFYQKSHYAFTDEQTLELLQKLRTRVTASEIRILAQKQTEKFDFLKNLDPTQIFNLIFDEKPGVQSIVLTQLDSKKRRVVFDMYTGDAKVTLMRELSKATTIPKEYLFNVANALHKKVQMRPEFDAENIRSSDILFDLLEKAELGEQRALMRDLNKNNPEAARAIKLKLVTVEVLPYLKDGHLLEIILGLERQDLLTFLVGTKDHIRDLLLSKAPEELAQSWIEEIQAFTGGDENNYRLAELKIINRVRSLANNGGFRLLDINERIFAENQFGETGAKNGTKPSQAPVVPTKYAA